LFRRDDTATGFHFQDGAVYAVCLVRERRGIRVVAACSVPLQAAVDAALLGGEYGRAAAAEALRLARATLDRDPGIVVACLGRGGYLLKMPPLPHPGARGWPRRRGNEEQLRWEMGQVLGQEVDLYAVDTAILGRRGLVVGARQAVLDLYVRVFTQAGLREPLFEVEPLALHNVAEVAGLLPGPEDRTTVVVAKAGRGADVLVAMGGQLDRVAHCELRPGVARNLAESIRGEVAAAAMAGDGEASELLAAAQVWVAGPRAEVICSGLAAELPCPCAPLPLDWLGDESVQIEDPPSLAVAAGAAVRRLAR